jgi:hypothetical protein
VSSFSLGTITWAHECLINAYRKSGFLASTKLADQRSELRFRGWVTGSRAIVGYCHGMPAQNKQRMVLDLNSVRQKWRGLSRPVACRTKSFFRRATTGDL